MCGFGFVSVGHALCIVRSVALLGARNTSVGGLGNKKYVSLSRYKAWLWFRLARTAASRQAPLLQ